VRAVKKSCRGSEVARGCKDVRKRDRGTGMPGRCATRSCNTAALQKRKKSKTEAGENESDCIGRAVLQTVRYDRGVSPRKEGAGTSLQPNAW